MLFRSKDAKAFPSGGDSGFDDMKSDELEPSSLPKVFDTSKMSKNRANRSLEGV